MILSDPAQSECLSPKRRGNSRLLAEWSDYESLAPSDKVCNTEHAGSAAFCIPIGGTDGSGCWLL